MSLQKKCITASAIAHGLVVMLVFVGSAFIPQKPKVEGPEFELVNIPDILVDEPNVVGGGNPNAIAPPDKTPLTQHPQAAPPQPAVQTPKPATNVKPVEPTKEPLRKTEPAPEVEKAPKEPNRQPDPDPFDLSKVKTIKNTPKQPEKNESQFDLKQAQRKVIKNTPERNSTTDTSDAKSTEKSTQMAQARLGALSESLSRVKGGLSTVGGNYEIPGPGGAAYASYHLVIRKIYENAWIPPTAARGNEPQVEVEVLIRKDGTIIDRKIIKKSGRNELDRTVQDTLNRVKKVPAFPSGSTDETRTFRFNFDLTSKLNLG